MPVTVIKKEEQAEGHFNNGAILEKKPIGFPQDGGKGKPYSNIFYWAYAWSDKGSTIGEHPHRGFEIMSFVLKGEIEHYDSQLRGWKKLRAGDAQIIRAGDGITHAERLHPNSAIFQIWIDPDLNMTLTKPPSYNDYPSDSFPVTEADGMKVKLYKGKGAPMNFESEGIEIKEVWLTNGNHSIQVGAECVLSCYVMDGKISIGDKPLATMDYAVVENDETIEVSVEEPAHLFLIRSPKRPSYTTYAERFLK